MTLLATALSLVLSCQLLANPAPPAEVPVAEIENVQAEHKPFVLDVREPAEIEESGSLPTYLNIPLDQLEQRLDELPRDRPILTV